MGKWMRLARLQKALLQEVRALELQAMTDEQLEAIVRGDLSDEQLEAIGRLSDEEVWAIVAAGSKPGREATGAGAKGRDSAGRDGSGVCPERESSR